MLITIDLFVHIAVILKEHGRLGGMIVKAQYFMILNLKSISSDHWQALSKEKVSKWRFENLKNDK